MGTQLRRVAIGDDEQEAFSIGEELGVPDHPADAQDRPVDEEESVEAEIQRLWREGWEPALIAKTLGVHPSVVAEATVIEDDDDDDFRQTPTEVYGVELDID